jgi:hypothetical protein
MDESALPWTKREIIDAMLAEYRPYQFGDELTWAFYIQVKALSRLALSKKAPKGFGEDDLAQRLQQHRPITEIEDAVFTRLGRILMALHEGRDPDAAYDMPLRDEMH